MPTWCLATYNIYHGAKDTYPLLLEFIRQHKDIDVLLLQEANGWEKERRARLNAFAGATGFSHCVIGGKREFKLATLSRHRIIKSTIHTAGFWHGAIRTKIAGKGQTLDVCNTHLYPFDEAGRLPEAKWIAENAKDHLVIGDLNGLSRQDGYTSAFARQLAASGNTRYLDGDTIQYGATDLLTGKGFIDAAASLGVPVKTFPARRDTELNPPEARFDYAWVPDNLGAQIEEVEVVNNWLTDLISDHRPIKIRLSLS